MTELPEKIVVSMSKMVEYAKNTKNRPLLVTME